MRKMIAAVSVGLLLVAGQAAAAGSNSAVTRVGDRVGASVDAQDEGLGNIPLPVIIIGGAVLVTAIVVATDDDSDS